MEGGDNHPRPHRQGSSGSRRHRSGGRFRSRSFSSAVGRLCGGSQVRSCYLQVRLIHAYDMHILFLSFAWSESKYAVCTRCNQTLCPYE